MNSTIQILGKKIILKYDDGIQEVFEIKESPVYEKGTQWFDFEDERYFLKKEKN